MYLSGTVDIKTEDGSMTFQQSVTFAITDIRPSFDGKPGNEDADRNKMKVTLMSPDSDIRVYEIDIINGEKEIYLKLLEFDDLSGFTLVGE